MHLWQAFPTTPAFSQTALNCTFASPKFCQIFPSQPVHVTHPHAIFFHVLIVMSSRLYELIHHDNEYCLYSVLWNWCALYICCCHYYITGLYVNTFLYLVSKKKCIHIDILWNIFLLLQVITVHKDLLLIARSNIDTVIDMWKRKVSSHKNDFKILFRFFFFFIVTSNVTVNCIIGVLILGNSPIQRIFIIHTTCMFLLLIFSFQIKIIISDGKLL